MDEVLRYLLFSKCYIDDVVIWSRSLEEHLQHLGEVFKRLREAGLKVHPGKCVFGADNTAFLGHRILANSLEPSRRQRNLCLHQRTSLAFEHRLTFSRSTGNLYFISIFHSSHAASGAKLSVAGVSLILGGGGKFV